ncbi:MAG: sigma-E factor negative regulatory protein [Cycloclasticus sp.]|nr:sigma-E factor negative regulatory protein [Cycloclasticus sp.]
MNDIYKEQISSLLDNELSSPEAEELLKAIENDKALSEKFDRYALIRDAFNERTVAQESFLHNIQTELLAEPTILAPISNKNKKYVVTAFAASLALFTIVIFDIGLFSTNPTSSPSIASIDSDNNEVILLEEMQDEELIENKTTPQHTRLVTFKR